MTAPHELGPALASVLLHALRLAPLAMSSPFLGGPLVPPVVRLALAAGLGGAAALATGLPPPPAGLALGLAALRELTLGAALGFLAAAPVEAARSAGRLVDTFRGATLAELHVAPIRQRESASGDLLAQWVVVLAAWGGGDRLLLRGVLTTFVAIPAGAPLPTAPTLEVVLGASSALLAAAVAVAAPAAAGVLAADLAVALAARLSPQLGAVNLAQPARASLGLALLAVAASAGAGRLVTMVALPGQLAGALAGGTP